MYYQHPVTISTPIGNNALSFTQRKQLGSQCKLTIPCLVQGTFDDIKAGNTTVFEEVDNKGVLKQCIGLENLLKIQGTEFRMQNLYVLDNHNHALYVRFYEHLVGKVGLGATLIHIDQHADMGVPDKSIDKSQCHNIDYIAQYTNEVCNVGNFIQPAIDSGLIGEVIQVRSVTKLLAMQTSEFKMQNYILDIDVDFRVSHSPTQEEIKTVQSLAQGASLCTIALSPYFMPLDKSIATLKKIFSYL